MSLRYPDGRTADGQGIGTALSAFFFSVIIVGAQSMSRMTGVPVYIAEVIQGMALIVMLIALLLTEYRIKVVKD